MIVSTRYTPKLFLRGITATLKEKPLVNGLFVLISILLVDVSAGFKTALITLGLACALSLLAVLLTALCMFILYRNKRNFVPISYNLTDSSIKITYGDRTSLQRYTRTIRHKDSEKVWFRNGAIFIKHKLFIHSVVLPEERRGAYIEAMRVRGWFNRKKLQPKQLLASSGVNIAVFVLLGLFIFTAMPKPSDSNVALSNQVVVGPVQAYDVLSAVNSQRSTYGLPAFKQDQTLIAAAQASCQDMSDHKYFGDQANASSGTSTVYARGYFADTWLTEVGAAVKYGVNADQIVSRWANNATTSDALKSTANTIAGSATCSYTVNNKLDTIVIVELGS